MLPEVRAMQGNLRCGRFSLPLDRPRVMGVLNVTPDSFSDGGRFLDRDAALEHARRMLSDGADIIDIGGESTRPGAAPTSETDERDRVIPLVEALRDECDARGVPLSVDTRKPAMMRAAIAAGASLINDVVGEVKAFLAGRAAVCEAAGIARDRIVVDPGFGFGKTVGHNLALLRWLAEIVALGYPVAVGLSRKSTIGALTGREVGERTAGSIAAALSAVARGAAIVRVHDVRETVDALEVWRAVEGANR